jgi:hypothetical protein
LVYILADCSEVRTKEKIARVHLSDFFINTPLN